MTNTVKAIKIVDPIIQSIMFVLIAFSLDNSNYYRVLFPVITCWQLLSAIIHFFIRTRAKLKKERFAYFFLVIICTLLYVYLKGHTTEKYLKIFAFQGPMTIPILKLAFVAAQGLLAFWYYLICIRELKAVMKKISQQNKS